MGETLGTDGRLVLRRMPDYPDPDRPGTVRWFIGGTEMDYTLTVHTASGGNDVEGAAIADAIERLWSALHLLKRPEPATTEERPADG
jgi:hypothetical protein